MTITQVATDVLSLVPATPQTVYTQVGAGGVVVLLKMTDMVATDEFILRQNVTFPAVPATVVVGSKVITHGTTTDDTWSTTAGAADADGYETWPLLFGNDGGTITIESNVGSYDIEYIVLNVGSPTG